MSVGIRYIEFLWKVINDMNKRTIIIILAISVLVNIGLAQYIIKDIREETKFNSYLIAKADIAIDNAVNISGQIVNDWDNRTEEELIRKYGRCRERIQ